MFSEGPVKLKQATVGRQSRWYTSVENGDLIGLTIKNDYRSRDQYNVLKRTLFRLAKPAFFRYNKNLHWRSGNEVVISITIGF